MCSTPPEQYSMLPIKDAVKLLNEKDDYINKLEEKTTNWVMNLKETIKEKDQRIKKLEKSLKQSQQQERIAKFAMKGKTQTELKTRWDNIMNC